jgi:hypothetical protein
MKVLLINPRTTGYSRSVTTPLGLLSIASNLRRAGHDALLYDRTVNHAKLRAVLSSFSPDIVGISLISFKSIKDAIRLSDECAAGGRPVVWGGPLASELYEAVLKIGSVSAVSIGEGEYTWIDVADALQKGSVDFSAIPGMAYRGKAGEALLSPERPFADLATLADIDWSLVRVEDYFQSSYECSRMLYLYAAKGCPHNCAFCYNKDFHKCRYRKRPMETLLREIRYLVTEHGMDGIYFADELWCRNVTEMHRVCDDLKSLSLPFVWGCQTRIGVFFGRGFPLYVRRRLPLDLLRGGERLGTHDREDEQAYRSVQSPPDLPGLQKGRDHRHRRLYRWVSRGNGGGPAADGGADRTAGYLLREPELFRHGARVRYL